MPDPRSERAASMAPPSAPSGVETVARNPWVVRSLLLLAALAAVAALKLGQSAIVPVLFATFLALLASPLVEWLARRRMPRIVAAALVMIALVAVVGAALSATWSPAREWLDTAPATLAKLERKLRPVTRFIAKVESVSTQAGRMTEPDSAMQQEPTPVALEAKGFVQSTQEYAIAVVSMLFLALFLLATDLGSLGQRGPPGSPWANAGAIFLRVRTELGRYFGAVTLSNLVLGVGTAATMSLLDMPNALLWGVVAFTLNFVPYAGSAATLLLLTVVALVSFDGIGKAVWVAGTYLVLTTFEGQVLQPVLVGRRLDISPPVVLLGLWFGGWLWGVPGIALAMPLLVSIKAAATEIARSRLDQSAQAEVETVRSRATQLLRTSRERYRRDPQRAPPR
jgi:predicted PurR-regulated permease PerM